MKDKESEMEKEGQPIQGCAVRLAPPQATGALTCRIFEEPWNLMAAHVGD